MKHQQLIEGMFVMGKFLMNLAAFLLVVIVNGLANALPLNGQTTGEISNRLDVLFTPAGYVFSIWGLIYLLLGIWVLSMFPESRRNLPVYQNTSGLFVLSSLLNSFWIFMWHYEFFGLSVLVMLLLLLTLIRLYLKLRGSRSFVLGAASFFRLLRMDQCRDDCQYQLFLDVYRMGRLWDFCLCLDDPSSDCRVPACFSLYDQPERLDLSTCFRLGVYWHRCKK